MKITEITYSKGQTYQIRQFEPVNVHASIKAELEEGEDTHSAYEGLRKIVDTEIEIMMKMLQEPQRVARAGAKILLEKDDKKQAKDLPF